VTTVLGPSLLQGIGFDKSKTSLLSMPFGALQIICIAMGSYAAYTFKIKGATIGIFMLPVLAGLAMLYGT
jgi:hypothetical protein